MTELLTAAQMRAIEKAAIEAGEVTGLDLMERAGRGVVEAMLEWRPELARAPHRAVVLCGPGNNGGDGFVVARLLKERGWEVEVFLYGESERLPEDARTNFLRWEAHGDVTALGFPEMEPSALRTLGRWLRAGSFPSDAEDRPEAPAVILDALFGTGLTRPADGLSPLFDLYECTHGDIPAAWVAIDVPTGMCSDSGRLFRPAEDLQTPHPVISADLTVTFHCAKVGHYLGNAELWCGRTAVRGIGLGGFRAGEGGAVELISGALLLNKRAGHKYDHGHALVLSGGVGKGGAARMAARGALRIGAGLVTVGCPPAALQENASALDAIMLRAFGEAGELAAFLPERKVNAVCIGPGFGHGERLRAYLAALLGRGEGGGVEPRPPGGAGGGSGARPAGGLLGQGAGLGGDRRGELPAVVLDADAISEFADDPQALFSMLHGGCVLTPHQGEFGRLFPDLLEKLTAPAARGPAYSKVDATREAAARAGCVVLFKGPDTVIGDPAGRCAISSSAYERAAPWLATAGTGDVLAGFITGLLARGFGAFEAAEAAAWLHVECALHFGPGLIAEDLPEQLPAVFRTLGS